MKSYQKSNYKFINEFLEKLEIDDVEIKPCTEEDIESLKNMVYPKELPIAYLEFMDSMGRYAEFLRGHSCFMNEIFDLKDGAVELLEENNFDEVLTDNDYVFWMSQGYMFCFFKLNEGNNTHVYFYNECEEQENFYKLSETFTEFINRYYEKDNTLFTLDVQI